MHATTRSFCVCSKKKKKNEKCKQFVTVISVMIKQLKSACTLKYSSWPSYFFCMQKKFIPLSIHQAPISKTSTSWERTISEEVQLEAAVAGVDTEADGAEAVEAVEVAVEVVERVMSTTIETGIIHVYLSSIKRCYFCQEQDH